MDSTYPFADLKQNTFCYILHENFAATKALYGTTHVPPLQKKLKAVFSYPMFQAKLSAIMIQLMFEQFYAIAAPNIVTQLRSIHFEQYHLLAGRTLLCKNQLRETSVQK